VANEQVTSDHPRYCADKDGTCTCEQPTSNQMLDWLLNPPSAAAGVNAARWAYDQIEALTENANQHLADVERLTRELAAKTSPVDSHACAEVNRLLAALDDIAERRIPQGMSPALYAYAVLGRPAGEPKVGPPGTWYEGMQPVPDCQCSACLYAVSLGTPFRAGIVIVPADKTKEGL
jgi:hypothetical protein